MVSRPAREDLATAEVLLDLAEVTRNRSRSPKGKDVKTKKTKRDWFLGCFFWSVLVIVCFFCVFLDFLGAFLRHGEKSHEAIRFLVFGGHVF